MHGHSRSSTHLFGILALVAALGFLVLAPSHRSLSAAGAAFFVVLAIKHLALLGVVGVPAAAALRRVRARAAPRGPGATLHSPRFYDLLAIVYCLGRERTMRARTLDAAGVAAGERVLDVCCGTGTLALAARRRVGAAGAVHGIDASPEMITRARKKAARAGLAVEFSLGPAQSLPFDDGTFDVVLCSLALHHLDDEARVAAIGEMRRVVKPGGRVLAVEFGRPRGLHVFLHPTALFHARGAAVVGRVIDDMRHAGLESVISAPLGFAGLTSVSARCPA